MTCSGTNGVQVWDTAFSVQASVNAGLVHRPEFRATLERSFDFLDFSQLTENLNDPPTTTKRRVGVQHERQWLHRL